jgi:serine/threonine protein kinase
MYLSSPMGSQVVVETLSDDVTQMRIHLEPNFALERAWLSPSGFESHTACHLLGLIPSIEWTALNFIRQLHDSIALVQIPSKEKPDLLVFKAVTEGVHYMYHELRTLLQMSTHPNVIEKPLYIVLKQCRFGGKVGICGFILKWHQHGNLEQALATQSPVTLEQKLHWSLSLVKALIHVRDHGPGFYTDLKPSNILLNLEPGNDISDLILVDFEQRGSWYNWAAPETRYIDYVELLAAHAPSTDTKRRYNELLSKCIPEWSNKYKQRPLREAADGYSSGWTVLSRREREKAQMFCLGNLLWCIFEEQPSSSTILSIETLASGVDQNQRFPEFRRTPAELRRLIHECTAGAPEWYDQRFPIIRKDDRIVTIDDVHGILGAKHVEETAKLWWQKEVECAEAYVKYRSGMAQQHDLPDIVALLLGDAERRPTLEQVAYALEVVHPIKLPTP